ncbi:cadherin-like domain-containing protein [Bradyrhizobium sp. 177]|uniref:Ig-like domain-containing protein n=1 Tax=Bradyrhizobium sp. 177 TaxID=2782647 RepID=UPI001FFBDFE2|nr:Ig-like domain-containing protein [Bradyrhizobium sp. 177]MCK1554440.1 cadherin-like domain-containing protein [Bradyrhizobium sp. 177]
MQNQFLLFEGIDANNTAGLWVTDGTAPGTHELTGINGANPGGLSPRYITVFDGKILFSGFNANGAIGLWVTDGTAAGTHELNGIGGANPGGLFSNFTDPDFTAFKGQVLFNGVNVSGAKGLWVTDGTAAGTHEVTGISGANIVGVNLANPAGVNPRSMIVFGDEVLFFGANESGNQGLWVTDGTAVGTHELVDISGSHLAVFNDQVLFESKDANGNLNLWVTDGTATGTLELTGISGANSGGLFSNVGNPDPDFTVFNGEVLFNGLNASGAFGLWVTDGTVAGTHEITGISGTSGLSPRNMTIIDNKVVFIGGDANGQFDLWVTDGTAAGTHQLTSSGLWPTLNGANFASFNGQVFFNPSRDYGLWVTDGTSTGTHELTGISAAYPGFLDPQFLTAFASGGTTTDQISPYIYDNTVFDQTSDTAPLLPWFYFFSIGATFLAAGDYSAASASYPGPGSPQTLGLIAPTTFDFGSPAFTSLSNLQAAYPFGAYTVTAVGNQISSTSSVSYQANYFTGAIPFVTNYSGLNGFNPANDFTVHYSSFTPDAHATTGFTFLTIWNASTHQVAFQDDFQSSSSTTALIPANTLSPNTNYTFELDFSDRLTVGSTTQGFDMRTDGSFTTGPIVQTNHPPVVDAVHSNVTGSISVFNNTSNGLAYHSADGSIAFTDADVNDRPTASMVHQTAVYQDAHGTVIQLTDAENGKLTAIENSFLIFQNFDRLDWHLSVPDNYLDFLGADQTVVLTSTIEIDDHHGRKVDQNVTITINGAGTIVNTDVLTGGHVAVATDAQIAVEMISLAVDAYPVPGPNYHPATQLGSGPNSTALSDIRADNWHALTAGELGLKASSLYSIVGGYYQAEDPSDALDSDPSQADALVLTGVINGKRTLAISFAGTDQLSDWLDYPNFKTHYDKFAPLIAAIKDFVGANKIDQVLVSGHSLGGAMAQDFMEEFPDDSRFRAWTIGSPGSEINASDARITNFVERGDLVGEVVPALSQADTSTLANYLLSPTNKLEQATFLSGALLAAGFSLGDLPSVEPGLLFSLQPKYHDGFVRYFGTSQNYVQELEQLFTQPLFFHRADLYHDDVKAYYGSPFSFKLVDGYISGATIFEDVNDNGTRDPEETSTTTGANGHFTSLGSSSPLVAFGGTDTSTGLPFKAQLEAPAGSTAITPLTTLLLLLQSQGVSNAEAQVVATFGIDPSIDLTTFDPIAALRTNPGAARVYSVGVEVMNTVTMIASALTNNGTPIAQNSVDVFRALANIVATAGAGPINLADVGLVNQLITSAAAALHHPVGAAFVSAVAAMVAESNSALELTRSQFTGQALIDGVSAVETLAQGAESAALQDLAGDANLLNIVVDAFTGSNLTNALSTQSAGANRSPWLATDSVASHAIVELAAKTGSNDLDTMNGRLLFTDADLSDTHQVSASIDQSSVQWMNPDGTASSTTLPIDTSNTLVHAVQATLLSDSTNGNIGETSWNFTAADHYFDFLAAGESLRATYNIAVTDGHGATSIEPVTIVSHGTNDNPTALPDSNGVAKGATLLVATSIGVLANDTDPDVHDQLAVSSVNGSASNVGHVMKGTYGSLTLSADGSYGYTANKGALPSQIVAQDTFNYTVSDGHSGSSTSTLSIVVSNPDVIYQSGMNSTLTGIINSKNVLDGSAGHDVLVGGSAPDVLIGGNGDTLTGGPGPDTFLFRPNFGTNVITDFNVNNDSLQFDRSIFASVNDVLNHATAGSSGAVIDDGYGDTATLTGIALSQLQAHQNVFHLV